MEMCQIVVVLRFGLLHKVIDVEYMRCFGQYKEGFEQALKDFTEDARPCLERGKASKSGCSIEATKKSNQKGCLTNCLFKQPSVQQIASF